MRKTWLIARREYLYNFRRRSYLFTAFGVPVFTIVMMVVIFALVESSETATGMLGNIGYVDYSTILDEAVERPEEYMAFVDEDTAHEAFLAGEIGAYFVIVEDYIESGQVNAFARDSIPEGIEDQLADFLRANVALLAPTDIPMERLVDPFEGTTIFLDTGEEVSGSSGFMVLILKPYVFVMLFLMAITTTSQFLMSGVIEEKENRMMEILATSSTPLQLLWGKVLGLGALGLTQITIWIAVGAVLISLTSGDGEDFLSGLANMTFSAEYLLTGLVYFFFGYFLYAGIMAGIGAATTAEQEARQIAGIFNLFIVMPILLSVVFFQDPNGTIPVILSLFPLTAPIAIVTRMPLAPVPAWQLILSLVLLIASVVGVVWLSARVFRLGMLMYGKRLSLREIISAFRQGRTTMTTVAQTEEV